MAKPPPIWAKSLKWLNPTPPPSTPITQGRGEGGRDKIYDIVRSWLTDVFFDLKNVLQKGFSCILPRKKRKSTNGPSWCTKNSKKKQIYRYLLNNWCSKSDFLLLCISWGSDDITVRHNKEAICASEIATLQTYRTIIPTFYQHDFTCEYVNLCIKMSPRTGQNCSFWLFLPP